MDVRMFGFENPLFSTFHHLAGDIHDDIDNKSSNAPMRTYVHDVCAMALTPTDAKELPSTYTFMVDMFGIDSREIKVQIDDDNVLVISGDRKTKEKREKEEAKYLRMERRMGKFMRNFSLPENADFDKVTAECKDGVLIVTVMKKPPLEPKKPKTVQVKVA